MEAIEKHKERRPRETEGLMPRPVTRMKEVPTRVVVEITHPPQAVVKRLRENLAPIERTAAGSNASVRLGQDAEIAGNADKFRNVDTVGNLRRAMEKAIG